MLRQIARLGIICNLIVILSTVTVAQEEEAIAEAVVETSETPPQVDAPKLRPLTITTQLIDDTSITGTLTDSTSLAIKTAFGEASIPLSEVAGIRFPTGEDTSTTVVMLNGDSITGATDLKYVNVETTWGSAKINGENIVTMLFLPGLTWQSADSLGGKRWNLVEKTVAQSGANRVQPASGVAPARPVPGTPMRATQPQVAPRIIYGQ